MSETIASRAILMFCTDPSIWMFLMLVSRIFDRIESE